METGRKRAIEDRLQKELSPLELRVTNESHTHNVPKGSETHFKVVVVSAAFEGKPLVLRHQLVYRALHSEFRGGLHALTITSKTPAEWQKSSEVAASPRCHGGEKG